MCIRDRLTPTRSTKSKSHGVGGEGVGGKTVKRAGAAEALATEPPSAAGSSSDGGKPHCDLQSGEVTSDTGGDTEAQAESEVKDERSAAALPITARSGANTARSAFSDGGFARAQQWAEVMSAMVMQPRGADAS
eukprot:7068208-Prymnesium_polylepis.1